ncbi:MAG: 3-hydroxybutyryl-CoA dehydrogenase [Flavobacteriaceae bacterium]|nr:MAG: 3-hydroxybutyryl-CoA dehydrogenase [Flavobacteriaceae bacterium]
MKTIAVLGAGTMGNGIAHVFAQKGYKVHLIDIVQESLDKALATIAKNLDRMVVKEQIDEQEKAATLSKVYTFTNLKEGVKNVDLVIEAATENEAIKKSIFKDLDTFCEKNTILATNTSSISITELGNITSRPENVIGMHFMNPVPLMELIEVIKGRLTSPDVVKAIMELSIKLKKIPVEVNDFPGFVANRILMPMINEAIEALNDGVSGVTEIDTVMKLGMAHPMGPLQLADFIGLDVCLSILNVMHKGFNNPKYAPCPLLIDMVKAGRLGIKSGEGFYDYTNSKKAENVSSHFN